MANFAQNDVTNTAQYVNGLGSNPWTNSDAMSQYGNAAMTLYGMYAANKANQQQQSATDQALQLQRYVLAQQQQNQMPYMQTGNAALQRLNSLMTPQGQTPAMVGGMGPADTGQMMMVTAPNGQTMMRPTSEMDHWRNLGATIGDAVTRPASGAGTMWDNLNGAMPQGQMAGPEHHYTKNALKAAAGFFGSQPGKTTDLLKRLFSRDKGKGPGGGGGGGSAPPDTRQFDNPFFGRPTPPGEDERGSAEWCALNPNDPRCAWLGRGAGIPPQGTLGGQ